MLRQDTARRSSTSLSPSSRQKRVKIHDGNDDDDIPFTVGFSHAQSPLCNAIFSSTKRPTLSGNQTFPPLLVEESGLNGNSNNVWRLPRDPFPDVRYGTVAQNGERWASSGESDEEAPSPPSFSRTVAQQLVYPSHHSHLMTNPCQSVETGDSASSIPLSQHPRNATKQSFTSSRSDTELLDQASVVASSLHIPDSLMAGKIINTEFGLALLLVPNGSTNPTDYAKLSSLTNGDVTMNATKCKHWSKAEDDLLHFAVSQHGVPPINWSEISRTYFPNLRRPNQCKNRWKKLNPATCHEPFTEAEDKLIIDGAQKGLAWNDICAQLNARCAESVRHRFVNIIDPTLVKNVAWTSEEDRILQVEQQKLGNKWKQIAALLPGRSENDVKNHWHNAKIKTTRFIKTLAAKQTRTATLAQLRNSSNVNAVAAGP